jgi:hypothetical protein
MTDEPKRSWQVPGFETTPSYRSGYIEEQIQEGEGILSGQPAYKNLARNMQIFDGVFNDKSRSTLCSNFLKYNIRKFVETISDVREIALFGSDAPQYKPFAEIENRVAKAIYQESQFPRQLRKANQYAAVMGTGYLWPKCKTTDYGWGERRIIFEPLGLLDVVPVQVPSSNDIQEAYLVTVYEYMPIAEAHGKFPMFQSQLKPIDQCDFNSRIQARRLDFQEKIKYGDQRRNWGNLYCEIRYTFIRDLRINHFNTELPMGEENTSWFYKVPFVGQSILGGYRDGQPFMRPAVKEDCRIYPSLRLIISNKGVDGPMYDGPAYDWHGQMPPVAYNVDDWPWMMLGLSLVDGVGSIEQTKRKHERRIDQILSYRTNPAMGYDRTSTGGPKVENFDIFEENVRVGVDGKPKDVLQALMMDDLNIDEKNFNFVEILRNMQKEQLGIDDLGSLMNMRLNISSDSFDKALETIGPIAKGIASSMEASNAKIGHMLKFMIPQWMDTARIIEYIGPDNIITEFFDYDPESMIPSHMPEEYSGGLIPTSQGEDGTAIPIPSNYDKISRARRFAKNLRLMNVPSTLLKITQMEEQTKFLALYGRGFPISPHTVAKKLGIDNFGDIAGDTEFEKWKNWKMLELLLMAQAQSAAMELGIIDTTGGAQEMETGKQHAGGRPPTDQKPGKLVMKDKKTSPRPVVKTSE